ncbi:MAG: hypothetical protein H6597_06115 [Flavobacteriales bacterium]|nr:hypothetical protein [Flavobacteriales bacterium]
MSLRDIDITDPIYAVTDTLAIVDDGTASDSLGCNALINGAEIAGKIAVVYRGTCEFGTKALNAQNAGAVGVIIVNNQGAPIVPGAGADGSSVTIPVVMISTDDGALLHDEIVAGNVVAFIGSIQGLYGDDIGFFKNNVIVPSYTAIPNDVFGTTVIQLPFGPLALQLWDQRPGGSDRIRCCPARRFHASHHDIGPDGHTGWRQRIRGPGHHVALQLWGQLRPDLLLHVEQGAR